MSKPMRLAMPNTAAFVDALRDAFGAEEINAVIKAGIDGQPTFWACEGGVEVGTRAAHDSAKAVSVGEIQIGSFNPAAVQAVVAETTKGKGKRRG